MTLWQYLKERIKPYKDRVAFANSNLTYADILAFEKPNSEKKLRICSGNTREETAINILKSIAEGNVAVPISKEYGENYCNYINELVDGNGEDVSELAFLMFTSGTTGVPKGVMLTDENVITNLKYIQTYFDLRGLTKICIARPLVHIAVLTGELLYALCNGLTVYFYEEAFMPKRLVSYFIKNGIEVFCATPTIYSSIATVDREGALPIKAGVLSGEILSRETGYALSEKYPKIKFYNVYGLTEHSPRVSANLPENFKCAPNSIGKAIGGVALKIKDGELLVKSPCVMKGYYKDIAQTEKKIKDGWLYTGDMAHTDENGNYYIDGRKDTMIIRSGINIYPEEIEYAVKKVNGVKDCTVFEERAAKCNWITLKYTGEIEPSVLRKELVHVLNPNVIPNKIEKVESLPKTASGKKKRI